MIRLQRMKRILLFIFAILGFVTAQSQYLQTGDIVSISFSYTPWSTLGYHTYMQASSSGILSTTVVNDDCLWRLSVNNGTYSFQDLTTGKFLRIDNTGSNQEALLLADSTARSAFSFTDKGSVEGKYMLGQLYYNTITHWGASVSLMVSEYNGIFLVAGWNAYDLYIEKWEQKGAGKPTGHFNPSKIEFTYAESIADNAVDSTRNVSFMIEATTESYYQCVNRPDEALLRHATGNVDAGSIQVSKIYWESSNTQNSNLDISKYDAHADHNRTLMALTAPTGGHDGVWQFSVQAIGTSPMGLKDHIGSALRWIDYADNVVVEYTYGGNTLKEEMRVVRKAYHADTLPALTFSINPVTYTFTKEAEQKVFDVVASHQHGQVVYNVDGQAIKTMYENGFEPTVVNLQNADLQFSFSGNGEDWMDANTFGSAQIKVSAQANNTNAKRSSVLTGTMKPVNEPNHPSKSFTIDLHQRGTHGGIQFETNMGVGNTQFEKNPHDNRDQQMVHTAEKVIYYLPNDEIELRLPESGFSGYMRWFEYKTNADPYYNEQVVDSTSWIRSPRAADGSAFAAINTPKDASQASHEADGISYGLYAVNKASSPNKTNGAVLDEGNSYNPMPIIKGWNYNYIGATDAEKGYHTMACDVSAYTDYRIVYNTTNNTTRIDTIQEPTLSYRQLFHLRPAEEMANRIAALGNDEYLEEYHYQAPAGKQVLLSTEYRHSKVRSHASELCYFYWNEEELSRVNGDVVEWEKDGQPHSPIYTAELDYLIVRSEVPGRSVYTLKVKGSGERIARFVVDFVDIEIQGPTSKTIITQQRINTLFNNLKEINFDSISTHLPWDQASYGYVYTTGKLANEANYKRGASQGAFPFYGEYMLCDSVDKDWARAAAHGRKGKALYVDGTMEPGLVASISAEATICSGQTLYCSAWFRNPAPSGWSGEGNPIFRCNIQGRTAGSQEWKDVGVYFVGELLKGTGWQQIVFPIESAHNYAETRVSIYNFATTNQGNDFMVDDITLFVSRLPIAAYQGKMACRTTGDATTSAAAVLRLDYSNINAGGDGYMYYQIYNESYDNGDDTRGAAMNLTGDAAYYHDYDVDHGDEDRDHPYGSVHIPRSNFNPEQYNDTTKGENLLIYQSVSRLLDEMVASNQKHAKAYIKTNNSGAEKWLLYVAHIIENVTEAQVNDSIAAGNRNVPLHKLYDKHKYSMRMAYSHEELEVPACNMQTPLHATQQTMFKLRNSSGTVIKHEKVDGKLQATHKEGNDIVVNIINESVGNCANDLYTLTSTIVNTLSVDGGGGELMPIQAAVYSDWLVGDSFDDPYTEGRPATGSNTKLLVDSLFKKKYGYTRGQVAAAIMYDMRRLPTEDEPNANYNAKTFKELKPAAFESYQNYEIIKHLCDSGWLQLYDTATHFYLASEGVARYWSFPIAGTAKAQVKNTVGEEQKDTIITIKDCVEPKWVTIAANSSDYFVNLAPITRAEMTEQQKTELPTVLVVEGSENVTIPIKEIGDGTTVPGRSGDSLTVSLNALTFMDMQKSQPMAERPELKAGDEYVVRLALNEGAISGNCLIGYTFFNLQVLPKTMIWAPEGASFNGWGKNENWKGWSDTNKDGKVQSTELSEGFVPTEDVNVVISKLDNPLLYPYIVPDEPGHEHSHYPMTVGFQPHHCKNIYFETGAMIHNQHLLEYDSAFVDMSIKQGEWTMVAAPLQSVYSGDMYIPHRGAHYADASASSLESSDPFTVVPFSGSRKSNAPYAFWISYYNKAVKNWFDNGQGQDIESNSAEFVSSNSMREALDPGSGFMLLGFGPDNYQGDSLTVRLPKSESVYYDTGGNKHSVPRTNGSKLAFTATSDAPMQITLTNKNASNYFLFGNPTMAYINMHEFLTDNAAVVEHGFYHVENGSWDANAQHTMTNDRYLAPMTSVMLKAKSETSSITLTLSPAHLTLNNQISQHEEEGSNEQPVAAPKRMASKKAEPELLTIYAIVDGAYARTKLAVAPTASDYYVQGEDALFISSGVETLSEVTTPLNMYTVAEQVPMMADVRQGISDIPLSVLVDDDYRTNYMQLAFYYSANWSRTCYFCDSYTGQKIRIMDGLIISVEMPQNHEPRYYIEGPDMYQGSSEGGVTTSTTNPSANDEASFTAYSLSQASLHISSNQLIQEVTLYDLAGRVIAQRQLDLFHTAVDMPAPSGMCLVKVTLRNGTTLYRQALVR